MPCCSMARYVPRTRSASGTGAVSEGSCHGRLEAPLPRTTRPRRAAVAERRAARADGLWVQRPGQLLARGHGGQRCRFAEEAHLPERGIPGEIRVGAGRAEPDADEPSPA